MKALTRRDFIRENVLFMGASIGTLAIGSVLSTANPGHAAGIQFHESNCTSRKNNRHKVLVAYASRCGSTGGVAEAIGGTLCDKGVSVDVQLIQNIEDISGYQTIVIGSAIRQGKWLPEAMDFVKTNRKNLQNISVDYFLTCLTMIQPSEKNHRKSLSYLDPIREAVPEIKPVNIGLFSGALDYRKLSFMTRMIMKSKMKDKGISEGDYRDWNAIRQWAGNLSLAFIGKQMKTV